jgi:hypothetical protein
MESNIAATPQPFCCPPSGTSRTSPEYDILRKCSTGDEQRLGKYDLYPNEPSRTSWEPTEQSNSTIGVFAMIVVPA